jgi:hypothetical protein
MFARTSIWTGSRAGLESCVAHVAERVGPSHATYRDQLEQATSPALATSRAGQRRHGRRGRNTHSPALLDAVRHAFVGGMSVAPWVSAGLMAAGAALALVFRSRGASTTSGNPTGGITGSNRRVTTTSRGSIR